MENIDSPVCKEDNIHFMSNFCLNVSQDREACFPEKYKSHDGEVGIAIIAGILCTINAFIGTFGNLLTLIAIPFAAKRKKYVRDSEEKKCYQFFFPDSIFTYSGM